MGTPLFNGALCLLIFVSDYSMYIHIYFLHKIFETLTYFIKYKIFVENQTNKLILILHFDNGGEFTYSQFNKFWPNYGH